MMAECLAGHFSLSPTARQSLQPIVYKSAFLLATMDEAVARAGDALVRRL